MKEIIAPVSSEIIEEELKKVWFVRPTNFGNNTIYIFNYHQSPILMDEVGRLRELTFRAAGGGTGKEADIDKYDTAEIPYDQLIVWDPQRKEILGGYRFMLCHKAPKDENGDYVLATSRLFNFSDQFIEKFIPYTLELGRSFVQPKYQSTSNSRQGIFALDNLWDGLGAITINNPNLKYFFGKVTMYPKYTTEAKEMVLFFVKKYFADKEGLVSFKKPLDHKFDLEKLNAIFTGTSYFEDYKILSQRVRALGENIPPLINAYMNLSPTMKMFGTALNENFGDVEESAIMITIDDIYKTKKQRHIESYSPQMK